MAERCDYNPTKRAGAEEPAVTGDCQNDAAVVIVRAALDGAWHLCESCAALPEFKRFKVRARIDEGGE